MTHDDTPPSDSPPPTDRVPATDHVPPADRVPPEDRVPPTDQGPPTVRVSPADRVPPEDRVPAADRAPAADREPATGSSAAPTQHVPSPAPSPLVELGSLTLGRRLGQGGQGIVHEVLNKRINESAPGGGWPVVYKEYSPAVLPLLDRAALDACVRLLGGLSADDGRWLCEKTAWPAALIGRQGQVTGFLMRAVPDRFRFTLRTLTAQGGSGGAGAAGSGGTERLATMEFLLNDDAYVGGVGLSVSDTDRLLLLADLAATMHRLHRLGVAIGDVSPKNLLFSLGAQPECFLIDCDAMRVRGATALPQAETPDWQVPAGEERATAAGDVHKLGLLAVRLFARDQTTTDLAALAAISPALGDLARASLERDPSLRPSPSTWVEQLKTAAATASTIRTKPPAGPRKPAGATSPGPAAPPGRPPTGGPSGPGFGPVTPRPASSPSAGRVIGVLAGLVAAVLLIVLIVAANQRASDAASQSPGPTDTYSDPVNPDPTDTSPLPDPTTDTPTPATDTPTPTPTDPWTPPSDPATDPATPAPTTPPVVVPPPPPPPPPPPTYYYGAIAVSSDGSDGRSWDAGSQAAADQKALDECPRSDCKILTRFVNSCGAVAFNPQTNMYWGGSGASETEAQNDAISNAGGGHWVVWACTTRP